MTSFFIGFGIATVIALWGNYSYRKGLILVANSHQSEKILGKWYRITPVNEELE